MDLPTQAPFIYRDFYDVPRMLVILIGDIRLLMDCRFDEAIDEYSDTYELYRMKPNFVPPDGSWESIAQEAAERLGSIPVRAVKFDPTHRQYIDTDVLRPLLADFSGDAG